MLDMEKVKKVADNPQIVGFELKLAQGAKPGQGGKLPKEKITRSWQSGAASPWVKTATQSNAWDEFHDVPSLFRFVTHDARADRKAGWHQDCGGNE
jgi:glutamate synthase domain-containing protein 2